MTALTATRTAQGVKEAEFTFTVGDTMANTAGTADAFATVAAHVFDIVPMPMGSTILSGQVVTDTAFVGPTAYNVKLGDSLTDNRYLGTTDKVAAGATAIVPTGYITVSSTGNLRLTVTPTVAPATAGKLTVRITYTLAGQSDYVL